MPDLSTKLLNSIQRHRLPRLDLEGDFIYPKYEDQSILNIPSSICRWLDAPDLGAGPLRPEILLSPGDGIRRVILVLMDALSLHRFRGWLENGDLPIWGSLVEDGLLAPLTSITPSTTCAATTTLWTGQSPASHGIVGYETFLKEYGLVANMILHTPMTFRGGGLGSLEHTGFKPEEFLPVPTLGPHLCAHGITPYAFQSHHIAHSGLSRMFMQDVEIRPFSTPAEMWINVRQLIEHKPKDRIYSWIYWGQVDGLSHYYEPADERVLAEFSNFSYAFEEFFIKRLGPSARKDTLLILTADHGQINTLDDPKYLYKNHPQLDEMLHLKPTGENRLMFLYVRPGELNAVKEYFDQTWPGQFSLLDPEHAIENGLFGSGEMHPRLRERLGDLVVIPHENAYLWWGDKDNFLRGRHGGLTPEEMLVPFLAVRL
ncbi:MAG: alkaline phosphatase family protein [Anaerolineales bacterium]|nr:alkaline phosphatase family protein [Chloroflexota bacterium]MBL6982538.1 alkaline phosphatase family protein [Anaerolineales bacterium]